MKRRSFIQRAGAAGLITMFTPSALTQAAEKSATDALEDSFIHPPASARPFTWWHWMNGNITREGITLDLEAMHRAGIGGVQCFNVGTNIPKGPVDYLGAEWVALTRFAMEEAGRLGIEFDMHNCPGWSSTGGPWITPEFSMFQFVWTETFVTGGTQVRARLSKPFVKLDYYRDTYVIAFPTLQREKIRMEDVLTGITSNKGAVDAGLLNTPDFSTGVEIRSAGADQPGFLLFQFKEPYDVRSVLVNCAPLPANAQQGNPAPASLYLEASTDGRDFRRLTEIKRQGNNIEMPATSSLNPESATYYRLVVPGDLFISGVKLYSSDRLLNWTAKAGFPGAGSSGDPRKAAAALQPDLIQDITAASSIDPATVLDITTYMKADGELDWKAPAGEWTVLRIGYTPTGRRNNSAPDSGYGLECDKYSRKAYDFHFNKMFENLLPDLKKLTGKVKVGLLVDSYEVGLQNWTKDLPAEFRQRRKYDFVKYLPAVTGRIMRNADATERFLWDLRRTFADLVADNYHGYFAELCRKHGLLAYTEPYNNGPFEQMQVGAKVDINMGEFWIRGPHFFPSLKLASSISHVFGKRLEGRQITGAEAFTGDSVHSKWLEHPYAMKAQGDQMFTKGLNRFIFHRYAHQPHPTALPGMTMGPWGFHFDRTNTWFEKSRAWLQYAARCQSLLQQGLFVADLLYYTGEDLPGEDFSFLPKLEPALPKGYDFDFANNEVLLSRITIRNGFIVLPDGMQYRVFVIPERKSMTIEVLRKIRDLTRQGMIIAGAPPERTPGLAGFPGTDLEMQKIVVELWGNTMVHDRAFGRGRVFRDMPLKDILATINVVPDVEFGSETPDVQMNHIHRVIGNADVYFIANRKRNPETVTAVFRVSGKRPELWNPDTGEIKPAVVYTVAGNRTSIPLQMDPAGSLFVVFRAEGASRHLTSVELQGARMLAVQPPVSTVKGRYRDVTRNFSIVTWIKPETDEDFTRGYAYDRGLASHVYFPPEGERLYGRNHAACGLLAARNGFIVHERTTGDPYNVLQHEMPLTGWNFVALVYQDGAPSLYVNGALVKAGKTSTFTVHPGNGEYIEDDISWYFEGDLSEPEMFPEALTSTRIRELFLKGKPSLFVPAAVQQSGAGKGNLLFWQDGRYDLRDNHEKAMPVNITGTGTPQRIAGTWTVSFPPGLGAPERIELPELVSLHQHTHPGVKYFSGTASYLTKFNVPAQTLGPEKCLYIDLGEVEVLAEVIINGTSLGILWKPPFLADISKVARAGENTLEIRVTNLWPNRLIGDEQLPEENEYVPTIRGGAIKTLPAWYKEGKPKPPGGRVTFSTWKHYRKDSPLLLSGLLGPVLLRPATVFKVPL